MLNKNIQETASLSIVLSLFIHKISTKHGRYTTASKLTLQASLLRRCRRILYNFHFQVQFLNSFRYSDNEFIRKYVLLLILDFSYENFRSPFAV